MNPDKKLGPPRGNVYLPFDEDAWKAAVRGQISRRAMTAVKLSQATGVSTSSLSRILHGDRAPDAAALAAISAWAGINPATYCRKVFREPEIGLPPNVQFKGNHPDNMSEEARPSAHAPDVYDLPPFTKEQEARIEAIISNHMAKHKIFATKKRG